MGGLEEDSGRLKADQRSFGSGQFDQPKTTTPIIGRSRRQQQTNQKAITADSVDIK